MFVVAQTVKPGDISLLLINKTINNFNKFSDDNNKK